MEEIQTTRFHEKGKIVKCAKCGNILTSGKCACLFYTTIKTEKIKELLYIAWEMGYNNLSESEFKEWLNKTI